ncbi:hypothetical protein [Clostridium sp. D53t1_180928_C8]|nr:hypothetical protein [Clostridium sp. D53t1_180928_C8]
MVSFIGMNTFANAQVNNVNDKKPQYDLVKLNRNGGNLITDGGFEQNSS